MTKLTSYEADIRPLFTQRDIQAMSKAFNLASYDEVKTHAAAIFDRIRGIGGAVMPPPPTARRRPLASISHRSLRQVRAAARAAADVEYAGHGFAPAYSESRGIVSAVPGGSAGSVS